MLVRRIGVALVAPYVAWLVFAYDYHFLDHVNLAFHEAGHLFFTPFGQTWHVLGGTLAQLFFPAACAVHLLRQERRFEALFCGLWLAESTMYVAWYLEDARLMLLPLVGGGEIHDWNYLLTRWGLLLQCERIAAGLHALASLAAIAVWAVAARMAWRGESEGSEPSLALR